MKGEGQEWLQTSAIMMLLNLRLGEVGEGGCHKNLREVGPELSLNPRVNTLSGPSEMGPCEF